MTARSIIERASAARPADPAPATVLRRGGPEDAPHDPVREPHRERKGAVLRKRFAVLFAALAVPAMAAPGDFGRIAQNAPGDAEGAGDGDRLMPFERPGMSFPGSAFYHLSDPPDAAGLVALPETDPLSAPARTGAQAGRMIDPGPAAAPFLAASGQPRARDCLAQAIWYEAASESEAGQRAVAQVVLNRVRHPAWPNSVCQVVYQGSQRATGCQFSFTCDGSLSRRRAGESWHRARRIAASALSGDVYAPVGLATHYHTLWVSPRWAASLRTVGTIGAHRFYRAKGRAGTLAAFDAAYSGYEPAAAAASGLSAAAASAPAASVSIAKGGNAHEAEPVDTGAAAIAPLAAHGDDLGAGGEAASAIGAVKREFRNAGRWKADPGRGPQPDPSPADTAPPEPIGQP